SSATSPRYSTSNTFSVSYSAGDAGSGVDKVELWAQAPGETAFAKVATSGDGSFSYTAAAGDGSYSFYTVAVDRAGNREDAPGAADATPLLDTQGASSTASSPAFSTSGTIGVSYNATDAGSGVDKVELWAEAPGETSFSKVAADTTGGSFTYAATAGDGSYAFYTVAGDKAGNRENAPATADTTTLLDTVAATSNAVAPQDSPSTTITVDYAASDPGASPSGLGEVQLWAKAPNELGYSEVASYT